MYGPVLYQLYLNMTVSVCHIDAWNKRYEAQKNGRCRVHGGATSDRIPQNPPCSSPNCEQIARHIHPNYHTWLFLRPLVLTPICLGLCLNHLHNLSFLLWTNECRHRFPPRKVGEKSTDKILHNTLTSCDHLLSLFYLLLTILVIFSVFI